MRSSVIPASTGVGRLAMRRDIVPAGTPCGTVERIFVGNARWGSLVIGRPDGTLTLLDRDRFMARMGGELGYGRALYNRQPAERLVGEEPVVALPEGATLEEAATAALGRSETQRYDDLLIELDDGGMATLVIADLFAALSEMHGHSALHDPLTGLANRLLLLDRLRHARARLRRHGGEIAILFIDLDDFKNVNDSLGHAAGDEVLVAVAGRLLAAARAEDTVARLGGDEFAVLLHHGGARGAEAAAGRIFDALDAPVAAAGRSLGIAASIGIAFGDASTPAELVLRDADLAMYSSKRAGKRRSATANPSMHAEALTRLELKADLDHALDRGELSLVYQPVVAIGDGRIAGVEALLRWHHPVRGVIPPGDFIALAEETGAIIPIGRWVLREACQQARRWRDTTTAADELLVGVNISPRQLERSEFVAEVATELTASGLVGGGLVVELTEGLNISNLDSARDALTELRRLGVKISIDDFGTGYTSLSYLRRLPIDSVKIDRAFVADVAVDPHARLLLDGLLRLADGLRVAAVAEGVESVEQLDALRELNCAFAQGYLLGRPQAADALLERLAAPDR